MLKTTKNNASKQKHNQRLRQSNQRDSSSESLSIRQPFYMKYENKQFNYSKTSQESKNIQKQKVNFDQSSFKKQKRKPIFTQYKNQTIHFDILANQIQHRKLPCQCIGTWNYCPILQALQKYTQYQLSEQLFFNIKDNLLKQQWLKILRLDLPRLNPQFPKFIYPIIQNVTRCVLSYLKLEYVQGMGNVVGMVVCHLKDQYKSWVTCVRILKFSRSNYDSQFTGLKSIAQRLKKLLQQNMPQLDQLFQKQNIMLQAIIVKWGLPLMCNIIPLKYCSLFLYGIIVEGWSVFYGSVLLIFIKLKKVFMQRNGAGIMQLLLNYGELQIQFKKVQISWDSLLNLAIQIKMQ